VIFAEIICKYVNDMTYITYNEVNKDYLEKIIAYQNLIAFHYHYGSKFKSDFWVDTQKNAKNIIEKLPIIGDLSTFENAIRDDIIYGTENTRLGCFCPEDHFHVHLGMVNMNRRDILI
jgi:hypothetical protein